MAAVLRLALLTATSLPVLATDATECLMIGKVYEDVSKQKAENVQKWEDCARACNQTDACSLFTYQPKSAFESTCWLIKDSTTAIMTDDPYSISGSKACLATRPTSLTPCPQPGVFFDDKILPDPHLWTASWQGCQAKCASHASCKYFTWKQDTAPNGGCWLIPSHNFTRSRKDSYAISGLDECPWKKLSDSQELEAKAGDPGSVVLDCRANHTVYKDLRLPSPKMHVKRWEDCQIACDDSDACEAYSYKEDTNPSGGCWLFRNLKYGSRIPDENAITGRKYCKIPSTPKTGAQAPEVQPAPQVPVAPEVQPAPQVPVPILGAQAPEVQPAPQVPVAPEVQPAPQVPVPILGAQAPEVQPAPQVPVPAVSPTGTPKGREKGSLTESSTGIQGVGNFFWLMLLLGLGLLCCFGLLCLAFQTRKSPKTRAVAVESETSTDEEVPVLAAAPPPAARAAAPPPPVQVAPRPAAVTYYRVKPMSEPPVLLEPSEPLASGV